jgi:hypothetical protein
MFVPHWRGFVPVPRGLRQEGHYSSQPPSAGD